MPTLNAPSLLACVFYRNDDGGDDDDDDGHHEQRLFAFPFD